MRVQNINNQNFEAKKFRLPVTVIDDTVIADCFYPTTINKYSVIKDRFVKEYANPKAEDLYKSSRLASTGAEKLRFLEQMGDFKIIDTIKEAQVDKFIKSVDDMP